MLNKNINGVQRMKEQQLFRAAKTKPPTFPGESIFPGALGRGTLPSQKNVKNGVFILNVFKFWGLSGLGGLVCSQDTQQLLQM